MKEQLFSANSGLRWLSASIVIAALTITTGHYLTNNDASAATKRLLMASNSSVETSEVESLKSEVTEMGRTIAKFQDSTNTHDKVDFFSGEDIQWEVTGTNPDGTKNWKGIVYSVIFGMTGNNVIDHVETNYAPEMKDYDLHPVYEIIPGEEQFVITIDNVDGALNAIDVNDVLVFSYVRE